MTISYSVSLRLLSDKAMSEESLAFLAAQPTVRWKKGDPRTPKAQLANEDFGIDFASELPNQFPLKTMYRIFESDSAAYTKKLLL